MYPDAGLGASGCTPHDEDCNLQPGSTMQTSRGTLQLLVIDDEASLRRTIRIALESFGHTVKDAANRAQALEALRAQRFDLAFLDLKLGPEKGLELLPELLAAAPGLHVVIVTAHASLDTAIEALRKGAFDYLPKPFTPNQLRLALDRSALVRGLRDRVAALEEQVRQLPPEVELDSAEPSVRAALDVAFQVAPTEATVLVRGESGTGKGVLARELHARSKRAARPFVTVHCPSLSADLLESDLFGHAKGAFTGAVADKIGKVDVADGGTLFLDEIGDLPLALQPKLLRLIQDKTYERVGEPAARSADVRIVAATNRPLEVEVRTGRFREDLFYRLNVIEITMPALRQRRGDVLPLARHLLRFFARQSGKPVTGFTPEAEAALDAYLWPGNVRELRNAVERGVILTREERVGLEHMPGQLTAAGGGAARVELGGPVTLEALEAEHIRRVVAAAPSLDEAARVLGINPSTLYRKRQRELKGDA
ncbi:Alginate biosynthesis transcriptional regulatory protein AlgB [Gemmata obscuriglobus]|nr:Alginate biosynthesis transcriptional regulatory protein AlgB [Gemmata obscuriglobus]VTS07835.1 chemotaxis protein : Response regulator with CheY-like receiver, AAA-type ATPase, and DNA-binding domains OS=Singulisphaera acidiphila (strain ATCC BAA-1392 / DSM 18658 / VKM B-2454 / MOB10) GN=Sinac_4685 PE=4 SV=1: Response_reg: Sigma54_activat: HTH_8 [Gemmata obscuriglobus UQM 2246]